MKIATIKYNVGGGYMKNKLLKTLLPIAGVAAVAAPVACLTSCSKTLFVCDKLEGETLWSREKRAKSDIEYTIKVSLSKLGKGPFSNYSLNINVKGGTTVNFSTSGCKVIFDDGEPMDVTPSGATISGTASAQYNSIKFIVYLEMAEEDNISFYFNAK